MSRYNIFPAEDFASLVTRDPKDILNLMLEISESSRQHPDSAYVIPFISIPTEPPQNVKVSDFGRLYAGPNKCRAQALPPMNVVNQRIVDLMPFKDIFSWKGYVTAGSFAALICQPLDSNGGCKMMCSPSDADFYPYCHYEDRRELSIQEAAMISYRQFLDDMTEAIESQTEDGVFIIKDFITKRNANCTTVTIDIEIPDFAINHALMDYQIIHRAHSSATSVIIGFDQMACKAFYDGDMVYFTLDAALCLYFGINPVDWRRESPSHLRRTYKYQEYGYAPIFPGLNLDLMTILCDSLELAYYLPGCLLNGRHDGTKYGTNEYDKTTCEIHMSFQSDNIDYYMRYLKNPKTLSPWELDRALAVKTNYLNFEQMPAIPFPKEAKESDYDPETTTYTAQCYHSLSMTIKEKYNLFSVYSDEAPNLIIDEAKGIDVRKTLFKVLVGYRSEFYFGTPRVRQLQNQMTKMILTNHAHSVGVRLLSTKKLTDLTAMQNELNLIFEARVKELEALVEPQTTKLQQGVTFITSNPGGQFTASFKPIIRQQPQDYWGSHYTAIDASPLRKLKLTLLCIRRFHNPIMRQLDSNIMKLIFKELDMAYFRHAAIIRGLRME